METKYNILTRMIKNLRRSVLPVGKPSDAGKVATVDEDGGWDAQTPASGGGVLVVTDTLGVLDKTWQEIHDAMLSGGAVISYNNENNVDSVYAVNLGLDGKYGVMTTADNVYLSLTASGYPALPDDDLGPML